MASLWEFTENELGDRENPRSSPVHTKQMQDIEMQRLVPSANLDSTSSDRSFPRFPNRVANAQAIERKAELRRLRLLKSKLEKEIFRKNKRIFMIKSAMQFLCILEVGCVVLFCVDELDLLTYQ